MIKAKLVGLLFIAACVLSFAQPIFPQGSYKVRYTAVFSLEQISFHKIMGYDMVGLKDGSYVAELGKPMLPSKEIRIALPSGMIVKSVWVADATQEEIPGEFNIFPAQPPIRTGLSEKDVDFVEPDQRTYTSTQPYPSNLAEFIRQSDLAGQGIAAVKLYPLQYVPVKKKLTLHTSLTLVIEGVGGYECGDYLSPNISEKGRKTYEEMVKHMVQNPGEVELNAAFKLSTSLVPPGGPFDHVIITSTAYAPYFQPLVDWHTQKGVKDTTITTSWIYSNYSGSNYQEEIRNFIIDANSTWGTTYFLLGGENGTVPFEYRTYYQENTASDQYYSDFDDDWVHEVFVGRASVGSTTEINTFINKVLKYEKDPPRTNYPLDVLLIGMDLDPSTHAEYLKNNLDVYYIPSRFNVTTVYDSDGGNHKSAAITALNAGQNLVNHADHCYINVIGTGDYWHGWGIYSSDVSALINNDQMSVVVSLGCHPNRMDASDCIAEYFVIQNPNQAGVAFTGNTRDGWGYVGSPISLSGKLDQQWWVGLFSRNKYNLGQTLVDSKHHFSTSQSIEKHCEWTFNLLGEPEMPIWTDEPDSFKVAHPSSLPPGPSSFSVHVEDATTDASVNQAYVCLWKENDVYLTGYTNSSGDVTFDPFPSTLGTMHVTVTKQNYLPYQQEVEVSGYIVGDASGDGVIDMTDLLFLISYLYKNGPAPVPLEAGDANCDSAIDLTDVLCLANYLYRGGEAPGCS